MKSFPPRLHALLASRSRHAVVIRRGPARTSCTLLWDRSNDEFRIGQWMRGRIHERNCDLSADGKYFIYFVLNGKWETEVKGAWTAISRAPYLKALSLYPKGDCWGGGGLFSEDGSFWLDGGHDEPLSVSDLVRRISREQSGLCFGSSSLGSYPGAEPLGTYALRLVRDGWTFEGKLESSNHTFGFRKLGQFGWTLRKIAHANFSPNPGKGCYWDEHELVHGEEGMRIRCDHWEWADVDRSRLVWATEGKLFAGQFGQSGMEGELLLHDFNAMKFTAIKAPY
jgi:hypothetical protein